MANYQVFDAYGSIITIQSSTFGSVERQIVGASILGGLSATLTGTPSISGAVGIIGSVVTVEAVPSIVGTYAEDSAHNSTDKGLFVMGVRGDTMSSVTSNDLDYSPLSVGPVGEVLVANAPITKWVQGVASCFTGVIQPIIGAQGTSVFTYITSGQVTNASGNNVYLTFYGATSSVVGYLPVPANSGALPLMPNAWKTNANGAFSASVSGVASVYLSFQGFVSKV